jgi:hypothetical protein
MIISSRFTDLFKESIAHDNVILGLIGPGPFKGNEEYNQYASNRESLKQEVVVEEEQKEGSICVLLYITILYW